MIVGIFAAAAFFAAVPEVGRSAEQELAEQVIDRTRMTQATYSVVTRSEIRLDDKTIRFPMTSRSRRPSR
jgi:hypothetical protein